MNCETITIDDLNQHVEGGWSASFEHCFLRAASTRFLIRQRDRFDATYKIAQCWVKEQVIERLSMCCADQLDTALGDGARRGGFEFASNLIDYDDFGIVILNCFDHHLMLEHGLAHLHAARLANGRMWHITVAADFIGCIHDDDTL